MRFVQAGSVFAYLYGEGTQYRAYYTLGAHPTRRKDTEGVYFALWAPHARAVSVVGTFNNWDPKASPLSRLESTGVWDGFLPDLLPGSLYKFAVTGQDGETRLKADPYGFSMELRPKSASKVWKPADFPWTDAAWMEARQENRNCLDKPLNIYEVSPTSWDAACTDDAGIDFIATGKRLAAYAHDMGFTHIELMPVSEYPLDMSWGYQCISYYAFTARLGQPEALMAFVDACHSVGIGVIMDWVPGHFCKDGHGLINFDGTQLYGSLEHPQWGTQRFDFSQPHVWSFLISNIFYWLENFHIDGIRVDGLASMLDLSFGREDGAFRNRYGGTEDIDAADFLRKVNELIAQEYPGVLLTAEDSSTHPKVTRPVSEGGLGFHYKWGLGWMHDTLQYMGLDPLFRKGSHNRMTFSMMYIFDEGYILPFSHDEVVHGKKSLIGRMPGDYSAKFANLRLCIAWQMLHPGKKLNFMGNEFAQFIEWRYDEPLEWFLLKYPAHARHKAYVKALNRLYLESPSLWERDNTFSGISWIDADNADQSIYCFTRWSEKGVPLVAVFNFTPVEYGAYRTGVDLPGAYRQIFNSNEEAFGGAGRGNEDPIPAEEIPSHGKTLSINFVLPGLSVLIFALEPINILQETTHDI